MFRREFKTCTLVKIGEDLNIQTIETVEQAVNIKTIKRKKIQTRKNNKKKALKNLNSNKKSFFGFLLFFFLFVFLICVVV